MKSVIAWLSFLIVAILIMAYFFIKNNSNLSDSADPIPIINTKSEISYRFLNLNSFSDWMFSDINSESIEKTNFSELESLNKLFATLQQMNTSEKSVLTFGQHSHKKSLVFTIQDPNNWNEVKMNQLIKKLNEEDILSYSLILKNKNFYQIKFNNLKTTLFVGIAKGILIGSNKENSLVELDKLFQEYKVDELNPLLISNKNFNDNQNSRVFFDLKNIGSLISETNNQNLFNKNWLIGLNSLAIDIKSKNLNYVGSLSAIEKPVFYNFLIKQKPHKTELFNLLPASVNAYFQFSISDYIALHLDVKSEIAKNNQLAKYEQTIENINKRYKIDIANNFELWVGNEMGSFSLRNEKEAIYFVKSKDTDYSLNHFLELNKIDSLQKNNRFKILSFKNYSLIPINIRGFLAIAFGDILPKSNVLYTIQIEGYQIFGSTNILKVFINEYLSQRKLKDEKYFQEFATHMTDESTFSFYSNTNFNKENRSVSMQFVSNGDGVNSYFQIKKNEGNSLIENEDKLVLKITLESEIQNSPLVISNDGKEKYLMVQDKKNLLYLINSAGKIKWKIDLNGAILGSINTIVNPMIKQNLFLFNTIERIFLIDINGQNQEGFPIKLNTPATCPLAVFDYNKNKDYRIFIAGLNTISAFSSKGVSISEWNNKEVRGIFTHAIKHLRIVGRDYIFASTQNGTFYFFDRKGNEIKKTVDLSGSLYLNSIYLADSANKNARLITTNTSGLVKEIYPDGRLKSINIADFSKTHIFTYQIINSNKNFGYVYSDEDRLYVYNLDKTLNYSFKFPDKIKELPISVFVDLENVQIGVVLKDIGQVFLINQDGNLQAGFPKNGNSNFTIQPFTDANKFDLIVGGENKSLLIYRL